MPAPKQNADRDRAIAAKARLGQTFEALASEYGLTRQRISQIVHDANPRTARETERGEIAATLRRKHDELQAIIDAPPARTTAIGKTVTDPDTGQTVRDMSVVVRAISEQLKIQQQYRAMFGTDIQSTPAPLAGLDAEHIRMAAEITAARHYLNAATPAAALPALPAGYATMTAEEQMRAQLDRRRTALSTQQAAIAAVPRDIIQGELAD